MGRDQGGCDVYVTQLWAVAGGLRCLRHSIVGCDQGSAMFTSLTCGPCAGGLRCVCHRERGGSFFVCLRHRESGGRGQVVAMCGSQRTRGEQV